VSGLLIGYARVSTDAQDLTAQRDALGALGVEPERVYVDHGFTGTHRDRPGLRQALAACRVGDTLVVTELDRLARALPDARAIADELAAREGQACARHFGARSDRSGRAAVVQRASHGRGVRG
jgi:DNA invertase Pin-like site-specific DNA recombinase